MTFLANMLREEGGYEYKKAIVTTIISIVEENPEAKESGKNFITIDLLFDLLICFERFGTFM
jgi:hypothetical protein